MSTPKSVADATQDFIDAREALYAALRAEDAAGVGRNEIARRAAPALSRATILSILGASALQSKVEHVLMAAGYCLGQAVTVSEGPGHSVVLAYAGSDRDTAEALEQALLAAGYGLRPRLDAPERDADDHLLAGERMRVVPHS